MVEAARRIHLNLAKLSEQAERFAGVPTSFSPPFLLALFDSFIPFRYVGRNG
jgi:hypothetical protein